MRCNQFALCSSVSEKTEEEGFSSVAVLHKMIKWDELFDRKS